MAAGTAPGRSAGRTLTLMKASHRRILRWVLGVGAAVVLVVALLVANIAAQISGGWDEVFDRSHPQDSDPEVVAARALGARAVEAEIDGVVGVAVPTLASGRVAQPAPTGAAAVDEPALGARCETGQHNWKVDDPYDLACVEVRRTILAADAGDFRADMVALDAALLEAGWTRADDGGLPGTLRYWDQNAGPFPGSPSGDDVYGPEDLPSAGYTSADRRFLLTLGFDAFPLYTGLPAPELAGDEYAVMVTVSHQSYVE